MDPLEGSLRLGSTVLPDGQVGVMFVFMKPRRRWWGKVTMHETTMRVIMSSDGAESIAGQFQQIAALAREKIDTVKAIQPMQLGPE